MTNEPVGAAVPLAQRQALVANLLPFAVLPPEAQGTLAARLQEERHAAGSVVAAEGEGGDQLYLIAQGQAAVTTQGTDGPVILTTLETGALFGEVYARFLFGQETRNQEMVDAPAKTGRSCSWGHSILRSGLA